VGVLIPTHKLIASVKQTGRCDFTRNGIRKPKGDIVAQETFVSKEEQAVLPPDLKDRLVRFVDETYGTSSLGLDLRNRYATAIDNDDILGLLELSWKVENSLAYWGEKLDRKERDAFYALDADLKKWLDDSTTI
jgi:hypothetical protein